MTSADTPTAEGRATAGRWTARRALLAHLALLVFVPGCIVACIWQIGVARSGNDIGWAYAVMWPVFSVYAVVLWWHLVHDDPETVGARGLRRRRLESGWAETDARDKARRDDRIARAEEEDPALAAYNAYLAALAQEEPAKTWRRR